MCLACYLKPSSAGGSWGQSGPLKGVTGNSNVFQDPLHGVSFPLGQEAVSITYPADNARSSTRFRVQGRVGVRFGRPRLRDGSAAKSQKYQEGSLPQQAGLAHCCTSAETAPKASFCCYSSSHRALQRLTKIKLASAPLSLHETIFALQITEVLRTEQEVSLASSAGPGNLQAGIDCPPVWALQDLRKYMPALCQNVPCRRSCMWQRNLELMSKSIQSAIRMVRPARLQEKLAPSAVSYRVLAFHSYNTRQHHTYTQHGQGYSA